MHYTWRLANKFLSWGLFKLQTSPIMIGGRQAYVHCRRKAGYKFMRQVLNKPSILGLCMCTYVPKFHSTVFTTYHLECWLIKFSEHNRVSFVSNHYHHHHKNQACTCCIRFSLSIVKLDLNGVWPHILVLHLYRSVFHPLEYSVLIEKFDFCSW